MNLHHSLCRGVNRVYPISRCRGTREPPSLMWLKDRHNLYYSKPRSEMGVTCVGRQKMKLGSKPLI
nr:MAG TPA: Transcription termination/antitermination protein [Caudoviricetes sp.]